MPLNASPSRRTRLLVPALLAAALSGGGALAAEKDERFPVDAQVKNLLAEGVQEFRIGRHQQAAAAFQSALKLDPENKLVFDFYLAAGDALLVRMEEKAELQDVLKDLLRRARVYQKQLRRDPAYIDILIGKLDKSQEERLVAVRELVAVGPRAVPQLAAALADTPQEERRTAARVVLTKMGHRAVLPLVEALEAKDQRLVRSAATVLADIGDPRALPKISRIAGKADLEDVTKKVLAAAQQAIGRAAKLNEIAPVPQLYLQEAMRLFRGDVIVRDEAVFAESLVWRWDESAEGAKKLSSVRAPLYAWNELQAEQLLFEAIAAYASEPGWEPLLCAVLAAEQAEAGQRLRLAKERTTPAASPEEEVAALEERVKAMAELDLRLRMAGSANLLRAVQQSITADRFDAAVQLMRLLQDRDLARAAQVLPGKDEGVNPDKPGSVLVQCLGRGEKVLAYQAAITLAHLDPALRFAEHDKVVGKLAEAVGEWGMRCVLVIDPDFRHRNTAREQLQAKGFMVFTAADGFEAKARLAEAPVKDAVIIAGDLAPTLRNEHGAIIDVPEQRTATLVQALKADPRMEKIPVFVALPENKELAAEIEKDFAGKVVPAECFVAKPFSAVELAGKLELALKDAQAPQANRDDAEDIALRAAIALQKPAPAATVFDLPAAADALAKTVDVRSDVLRIEALKALGHAAGHPGGAALKSLAPRLTDVYNAQDGDQLEKNPALRAAFLYAIGMVDPSTEAAQAIIGKALGHAEAAVRAAAAAAAGHGQLPDELLHRLQRQQRLDLRAAGAGKD